MNARQRLVLALAVLLVAVQILYPPWMMLYHSGGTMQTQTFGRAWVWNKPASTEASSSGVRIQSAKLAPGIFLVAIAGFIVFHLARTKAPPPGDG